MITNHMTVYTYKIKNNKMFIYKWFESNVYDQ